jgi:tRNA pseudouridine55 synthase
VTPRFTREELEAALGFFRGAFLQTPPPFSAKKIAGTPAYRLARKQIAVELRPVEVNVFAMELLEFGGDTARVRVHCSAGTYLRSIAHETGQKLGCGAFLDALRRTSSGDFTEDQARTLDQLTSLATAGAFDQAIVPASQLLPDFPNATVDAMTVSQIRQGKDFRLSPFVDRSGAKHVKAVSPEGDLIAIGEARLPHLYHPILVL